MRYFSPCHLLMLFPLGVYRALEQSYLPGWVSASKWSEFSGQHSMNNYFLYLTIPGLLLFFLLISHVLLICSVGQQRLILFSTLLLWYLNPAGLTLVSTSYLLCSALYLFPFLQYPTPFPSQVLVSSWRYLYCHFRLWVQSAQIF